MSASLTSVGRGVQSHVSKKVSELDWSTQVVVEYAVCMAGNAEPAHHARYSEFLE
jgi:hypothetical protein